MPLRKRKARRCPKTPPCSSETKENTSPEGSEERHEENGLLPRTPAQWTEEDSMDDEERKARETIAQLAKKYQVTIGEEEEEEEENSESLDIIRPDDSVEISDEPTPEIEIGKGREEEDDEDYREEEPDQDEVEREEEKEKDEKRCTEKRKMPRIKLQKLKQGSTPVFKIPKPLAHHSTPSQQLQRDLFGFEELDSPLTLSPVQSTPAGRRSRTASLSDVVADHRLSPENEESEKKKMTKPSPYSRIQGTYDIPFRKKAPRRLAAQRRKSISGEERWAVQLKAQFNEVEQFELAVE